MRAVAALVVAEIVGDASDSFDTLEEIAAWIEAHPNDVAAMVKRITDLETAMGGKVSKTDIINTLDNTALDKPLSAAMGARLNAMLSEMSDELDGKTTPEQVAKAISDALTGYAHRDHNHDGTYAKPADIPTKLSQLAGDSTHRTVTDAEKTGWSGKADGNHNHDSVYAKPSDIPTVPSALPNPYALTILGKSYTGGKAVSLTAEEIMDAIKIAAGGVVSYLDGNKIVLSGNLLDATYTAYYEVDGELVEIGDLTLGAVTPDPVTYTIRWVNYGGEVLKTATVAEGDSEPEYDGPTPTRAEDGQYTYTFKGWDKTVDDATGDVTYTATYTHTAKPVEPTYTNILTSGAYTVNLNKRWSSSSKADTACNGMIYLKIPIADVTNKTIYFKGFPANAKASNQGPLWFGLDSTNTRIATLAKTDAGGGNLWTSEYLVDEGNGVYSIPINATTMSAVNTAGAYLLIDMATVNGSTAVTSLDGFIMTIGDPIA
jgi:hypothetical protein